MVLRGCWQGYQRAVARVSLAVNTQLGRLGAFVAARSVLVLLVSLFVALGLSAGMARIGSMNESAAEKLWIPRNSVWEKHDDYVAPRLGSGQHRVQVIFEPKEGKKLLTIESVREMFTVQQQIFAVPVTFGGKTYTWETLCWKDARGRCRSEGLLALFDDSPDTFEKIAAQGEAAFREALSSNTYPNGNPTSDRMFYKATRNGDGQIVDAEMAFWASNFAPDLADDLVKEWTFEVEDLITSKTFSDALSHATPYFDMPTSIDNAIGESVGGDAPFIAIAVMVVCVFVVLALFVRDRVFTRTSLALCGIASVCLSIAATLGFSMLIGIPFTNLSQILPFILLGIGVDDLFVLVRSLEEVDERYGALELTERFRRTLAHGGMSISVTTLTNITAFMFGSMTTIPAVRWFCWTAAIGIFFDWALQVTFFVACFALSERRIAAGRYDFFCCWKRAPVDTIEAANRQVTTTASGDGASASRTVRTAFPLAPWQAVRAAEAKAEAAMQDASADSSALAESGPQKLSESQRASSVASTAKLPVGFLSASKDSYLQIFLNRFLLPPLFHPVGRALVILAFVGVMALGIVGITRLGEGLDLSSLAPDGHYTKDYYVRDNLFLATSGYGTRVVFSGLDQSDPSAQRKMFASIDNLLDNYHYFSREKSPTTNWLTSLHAYVAEAAPADAQDDGTVAQANFYEHLAAFLEEQPIWQDDIAFTDTEPRAIDVSAITVVHTPDSDLSGAYERKVLEETLDAVANINREVFAEENARFDAEQVFIVQAAYYKYWETSRVIFRELALNLGMALLGVGLISAALLISPAAVLLVMAAVVSVDLFLFAEMWLADIPVNTISVVNLVMAVGLAVDYSLHVMHTFLSTRGETRLERIRHTMLGIAAAVLLAVVSTFLGVLAMAGSTSEIIRTLFELLLGTVLFGGFVGLVVLPVVLSLVGPKAVLADTKQHNAEPPAAAAAAADAAPVAEP